ncbi:MAG: hypothetical protein EP335_00050 [Alphaproteobacteria bacterium]|nr:MAG: hypothetical protein EP335_00050 [Alphaproteobacteria bacterium]
MTAFTPDRRRYDLDWLRVIAFGLLILYHIGMFYVTWDWHVKSAYTGSFAEPAMMLLNPWRLALLFFISGVALRFAADKAPALPFAGKRFVRLFIPLLFGMLVIVTPQSYFQLLRTGEIEPGYLAFWQTYLTAPKGFSITLPTWNHLWYVAYLLVYSLLAIALMPLVRRIAAWLDGEGFARILSGGRVLLLPAIPFIIYRFTLEMQYPETHALFGDWAAHARYGTIFLFGLLFAKSGAFWGAIRDQWRAGALAVLISGICLSPLWAHWDWVETHPALMQLARAWRVLYAWMVIATLMGAAGHYLNRPSPLLAYLTRAVFPYYILHQTLIVVFGVWLSGYALGAPLEFISLVVLTTLGCGLGYHYLIRPFGLVRPLFGVFGDHGRAAARQLPTPAE